MLLSAGVSTSVSPIVNSNHFSRSAIESTTVSCHGSTGDIPRYQPTLSDVSFLLCDKVRLYLKSAAFFPSSNQFSAVWRFNYHTTLASKGTLCFENRHTIPLIDPKFPFEKPHDHALDTPRHVIVLCVVRNSTDQTSVVSSSNSVTRAATFLGCSHPGN